MLQGRTVRGPRMRGRWIVGGAASASLLLGLAGSAAQAAGCQSVSGKMTLVPVSGADCASPVGVCAVGEFKGGIAGTLSFTATSVVPTADTPTTAVVLVTGDNLITTKTGTLATKDAIAQRTTGSGDFAEVDTIVGGTDVYAGATGSLTATGTYSVETGGEARYSGEICLP